MENLLLALVLVAQIVVIAHMVRTEFRGGE